MITKERLADLIQAGKELEIETNWNRRMRIRTYGGVRGAS